jgi:peroxiredoxin Q/BCP
MSDTVIFDLPNQSGQQVSSKDFAGRKYVMFFYPRAMTPGCTTESCDFRDSYSEFADAGYDIVGVSPDPPERNLKFKEKEGLNFDLLSDEDHGLAESLGAWGEKKMYGKTTEGLIRSTFVIDDKGHVERVKKELLDAS